MPSADMFVPIENLALSAPIQVGRVAFHPSTKVQELGARLEALIARADAPPDWKEWRKEVTLGNIERFAEGRVIASVRCDVAGDKNLLRRFQSGEVSPSLGTIKQALSVLHLLKLEVAGRFDTRYQVFGLSGDLTRAAHYIVAVDQQRRGVREYRYRHGALASWEFTEEALNRARASPLYDFFHAALLKGREACELQKRLLNAAWWVYEAALEFGWHVRCVKLLTALEAAFVPDGQRKSFGLAKMSAMLLCDCVKQDQGYCPIPDAQDYSEYQNLLHQHKSRVGCSLFDDMRDWYALRSEVVHEGFHGVAEGWVLPLEWRSHEMLDQTVRVAREDGLATLEDLWRRVEERHRAKKL